MSISLIQVDAPNPGPPLPDIDGPRLLALSVVKFAVRDALDSRGTLERYKYTRRLQGYARPCDALRWMLDTADSTGDGSFGFFCLLAGYRPWRLLEDLEAHMREHELLGGADMIASRRSAA